MKYDDASWHYGGNFPKDLPDEAGATHIGMFLAWALLSGLAGEAHTRDAPDDIARLRSRTVTPGVFLLDSSDEKLVDASLNDEGNAFAQAYYGPDEGQYFEDYAATLGDDVPDIYHVTDTWEKFDRLKPVLDRRFMEWKATQR